MAPSRPGALPVQPPPAAASDPGEGVCGGRPASLSQSRRLGGRGAVIPLSVLVTTRNEEANVERCLQSVHGFADQIFVLDSESTDRTVEIARRYAEVHTLAYDHGRIIPWIFQWGL